MDPRRILEEAAQHRQACEIQVRGEGWIRGQVVRVERGGNHLGSLVPPSTARTPDYVDAQRCHALILYGQTPDTVLRLCRRCAWRTSRVDSFPQASVQCGVFT